MIRFDDILEKVAGRFSDRDITRLQKAYVFSARVHQGQVRRSGEPYLSHPLEVAALLADMHLDATTLVAGLLHDVLEDTEVPPAELRRSFGAEVAGLVESVTKISRVQEASPALRRAETIRKIILAMTDDVRVIFVKLADRLHNLQTLKFLPEEKQRQIAAETLEIYAPIANRLGMGRIKAELEDLAFRYVEPEEYFRIAAMVDARRKKAARDLKAFQSALERLLAEHGIPAEVQARIKRPYGIWRKMKAQRIEFDQVYDFLALRIVTDSIKNCYAALGAIHGRWSHIPHRFRDFIAMPKPNLYQALHTTVLTEDKQSFEIQIRTREMHLLAEQGIGAHWRYKDADPQSAVKDDKRLEWLREMVEVLEEQRDPEEFLKSLKINLIPEEVYVFTPKGQVVTLPTGASALDFAFRIHTQVGLHAAGAKINGRPAPLRTPLRTGDIVEIQTSPERSPTRAWLNAAFTSGARHRIKRWLKSREVSRSVALGRKLWRKELRRYALPPGFPSGEALLQRLRRAAAVRASTMDEFLALVGRGRIVLGRKLLEKISPPGLAPRRAAAPPAEPEIRVGDLSRELVRLARCCSPIKGEPIVGYLTAGRGITVHARRCPRVARELLAPERIVEVSWGKLAQGEFKAGLTVRSTDAPGLLAKVASAISGLGGDVSKAEVEASPDGRAEMRLTLAVRDISQLEAIVKDIARVPGVRGVERS